MVLPQNSRHVDDRGAQTRELRLISGAWVGPTFAQCESGCRSYGFTGKRRKDANCHASHHNPRFLFRTILSVVRDVWLSRHWRTLSGSQPFRIATLACCQKEIAGHHIWGKVCLRGWRHNWKNHSKLGFCRIATTLDQNEVRETNEWCFLLVHWLIHTFVSG